MLNHRLHAAQNCDARALLKQCLRSGQCDVDVEIDGSFVVGYYDLSLLFKLFFSD